VAANPQTKPIDSAENWPLPSTSTIARKLILISPAPLKLRPYGAIQILFIVYNYYYYRPTEGGRLSRPRHCSKGAQPVPRAEYRTDCRDKHNCPRRDSNLDPSYGSSRTDKSAHTHTHTHTHTRSSQRSRGAVNVANRMLWIISRTHGFYASTPSPVERRQLTQQRAQLITTCVSECVRSFAPTDMCSSDICPSSAIRR